MIMIQRTVIIQRDEKGFGLRVSGDNPVFVESVKPDGAAWKAGVRPGDKIMKVNGAVVIKHNHQEVVKMIQNCSNQVALTLLGSNIQNNTLVNSNLSSNQSTSLFNNNLGDNSNVLSNLNAISTANSSNLSQNVAFTVPCNAQSSINQNENNFFNLSSSSNINNLPLNLASSTSTRIKSQSNLVSNSKDNSVKHITLPLPANESILHEFKKSRDKTLCLMHQRQTDFLKQITSDKKLSEKEFEIFKSTIQSIKQLEEKLIATNDYVASVGRYVLPLDASFANLAISSTSNKSKKDTFLNIKSINNLTSMRKHLSAENLYFFTNSSKSNEHKNENHKLSLTKKNSINSFEFNSQTKKSHSFGQYDHNNFSSRPENLTGSCKNISVANNPTYSYSMNLISDLKNESDYNINEDCANFLKQSQQISIENNIEVLLQAKNKNCLLRFIHYLLIYKQDINPILFYVLSDLFKKVFVNAKSKQTENYYLIQQHIRKWAFEIYSTFLFSDSPLRLDCDSTESNINQIEEILNDNLTNQTLNTVFDKFMKKCRESINNQIEQFKQCLASGSNNIPKRTTPSCIIKILIENLTELPQQLVLAASSASTLLGQLTILISYLLNNVSFSNILSNQSSSMGFSKNSNNSSKFTNNSKSSSITAVIAHLTCFTSIIYHCYPHFLISNDKSDNFFINSKTKKPDLIYMPVPVYLSFHQSSNSFTSSQQLQLQLQHKRHKSLPSSNTTLVSSNSSSTLSSNSFSASIPYHLSSSSQPTGNHNPPQNQAQHLNKLNQQHLTQNNNKNIISNSNNSYNQLYTRCGHIFLLLEVTKANKCSGCGHFIWAMFGWQCNLCSLIAHHWCLRTTSEDHQCPGPIENVLDQFNDLNQTNSTQNTPSNTISQSMSQLITRGKSRNSKSTFLGNILKKTGLSSSSLVSSNYIHSGLNMSFSESTQLLPSKITDLTGHNETSSPLSLSSSNSSDDLSNIFMSPNTSNNLSSDQNFGLQLNEYNKSNEVQITRSESLKQKTRENKTCSRKKSDPSIPFSNQYYNDSKNCKQHIINSPNSLSSSDGENEEESTQSENIFGVLSKKLSEDNSNLIDNRSDFLNNYSQKKRNDLYNDHFKNLSPPNQKFTPSFPPRNSISQQSRKALKRQDIFKELILTEKTHVKNLKILNDIFYTPIYKEQLLNQEQIEYVFSNHSQLYDIHCQIYQLFKRKKKEQQNYIQDQLQFPKQHHQLNNLDQGIGSLLVQIFEGEIGAKLEKAASVFCANQAIGGDILRNKLKKDSKLSAFLTEAEAHKCCRRLQLKDMLASCFQRITKYPLLMENLMKEIEDKESEEFKLIERACKKSKDILTNVNECIKKSENRQKMLEIQRKTEKSLNDNIDFGEKELIYEGNLTLRLVKKSFDVLVLLCSDVLIFLFKEGDKYFLKNLNKNTNPIVRIENVITRNNATDSRGFYLISKQENFMYEFVASSETEKNNWVRQIDKAAVKSGGNIRSGQIKLRDLTSKELSLDKLKENDKVVKKKIDNFDEEQIVSESKLLETNSINRNEQIKSEEKLINGQQNLNSSNSSLNSKPRTEGTISFVQDEDVNLNYNRDFLKIIQPITEKAVLVCFPEQNIFERIKNIEVEIERLQNEKQQLLRCLNDM